MSLPYFPMYPTDFEADTSHLTLAEDGAYNRLLRLMWMTPGCTLPADEKWIMRRMRVSREEFDSVVKVVIEEFFTTKSGRLINPKLAKIYAESSAAHKKRVSAGSKGGKAKSLKTNKTTPSNAKAMLKQPEPEPYKEEDTNVSSKKKPRGTRLSKEWSLPKDWGDWALSNGWSDPVVRLEAEKFKDFWISKAGQGGVKLDWQATWRNWMRNSNSPKTIIGGEHERPNKSSERVNAFVSGARGSSRMDRGQGDNPSQPLLARG